MTIPNDFPILQGLTPPTIHPHRFCMFPHLSGEACYRFYVSCPASSASSFSFSSSGPQLQALDRTNTKLRSRMTSAGPQLQALDRNVPRRTRTANSGSECFLPGLNHKESPKIYQIESQKECQKICQIECQKECQNICQKVCQNRCQKEPQSIWSKEWLPDDMSETMSELCIRVGITRRK